MEKQLTREEAIAFAEGGEWKAWSHAKIAKFQMQQDKLCVPFDVFHEAVEKYLGRPVWSHEFAFQELKDEVLNGGPEFTIDKSLRAVCDLKEGKR